MFLLILSYRVGRMGQIREEQLRLDAENAILQERLVVIGERIEERRNVIQSTLSELEKRRRDETNSTTTP